jgi:hypothetical protein
MAFTFSLDEFEQLVYTKENYVASFRLIGALALLEHNRGEVDANFLASDLNHLPPAERSERYCTRLASAISTLFSRHDFTPVDDCYRVLLTLHPAARLALVLLAPVFQGSAHAHGKREALLEWLPGKLQQIDDLDDLPTAVLHHAYMFCSYADSPRRHAIKRDLNVLIRASWTNSV